MLRRGPSNLYRTVIVAMVAVGMVKHAVDQVVDVVAVGYRLMATTRAMLVLRVMRRRLGQVIAPIWVRITDGYDMLLHLVTFLMAEMAIVQEIDVAIVFNCRMTATRTVRMSVLRHDNLRKKKGSLPLQSRIYSPA